MSVRPLRVHLVLADEEVSVMHVLKGRTVVCLRPVVEVEGGWPSVWPCTLQRGHEPPCKDTGPVPTMRTICGLTSQARTLVVWSSEDPLPICPPCSGQPVLEEPTLL